MRLDLQVRCSFAALPTWKVNFLVRPTVLLSNHFASRWKCEHFRTFDCSPMFLESQFFQFASPHCQRVALQIVSQENRSVVVLAPLSWTTIKREPCPNCGTFRFQKLQQSGSILHFDIVGAELSLRPTNSISSTYTDKNRLSFWWKLNHSPIVSSTISWSCKSSNLRSHSDPFSERLHTLPKEPLDENYEEPFPHCGTFSGVWERRSC